MTIRGWRREPTSPSLEGLVIALVALIAGCFLFELIIARPDPGAVMSGLIPSA